MGTPAPVACGWRGLVESPVIKPRGGASRYQRRVVWLTRCGTRRPREAGGQRLTPFPTTPPAAYGSPMMKSGGTGKGSGIAIGIALGVGLGAAMGNIAVGIAIGVALGAALESRERRSGSDDD
jgi:hypothetical protein